MLINLHNHTPLCNHATGTIDEYIQKAIKSNISYFGFSDHAPMNFDKEYRMDISDCYNYENNVLKYKEKYKNNINILLAYEVDYIYNYLEDRILNANVDYLIGSVHFIKEWGFDNPKFIKEYKNRNIDDIWQDYFDSIEQMANSGYFNIVGHLDLIKVFNFLPKKDIKSIAKKSIIAIKKNNMIVEVNSSGLRKPVAEQYPSRQLLELCLEYDIDITFSSDAHKISHIDKGLSEIYNIARDVGYSKMAIFKDKEKIFLPFD
ncbi:Histidinol-phosphatase [hydrothermal vent metagenome]|uniref:histidinol-phosphatase n=1 Tax=hydrothermal vent metagenome TaxID=652676 RepID=A0A3B1EA62_9ZZZZ